VPGGTVDLDAVYSGDATYITSTSPASPFAVTPANQAVLKVASTKGYVGQALKLSTSGGSSTGVVTYTVTNGTATGCVVSGGSLNAASTGTCLVTATMAASANYLAVSSSATAVAFQPAGPRVIRIAGALFHGHTQVVTIVGYGFYGRPRIITNAPGLVALVTRDTGTQLRITVRISNSTRPGVHVVTVILANNKRASARFNLR
jgi:hypothetical protein